MTWPDRRTVGFAQFQIAQGMLFLLVGLFTPLTAQDLHFQINQTFQNIRSRQAGGQTLYELEEIISLLDLELVATGERSAEVRGPRGRLVLTEGRPLLRYREEYILLSSAVRKATDGAWFVPEDILEKGLAQVMDRKLEQTSRYNYRLDRLDSNVVRVDIVNYPDHVTVIFSSTNETPFRVREYRRYLKVEFEGFSIQPQITRVVPNQELIRQVRFDSFSRFGNFEIVKGSKYFNYRQYSLSGPDRQVVAVYGRPVSRGRGNTSTETLDPPVLNPSRPTPPSRRPSRRDLEAPEFRQDHESRIITIDPGHGGDDAGVAPTQEVLEAQVVWQVTQQIQEFLSLTRSEPRLTRDQTMNPSLEQRSAQSNGDRSKAFVSVHLGASETQNVRGPVVYIHRYFDRRDSQESIWLDWHEGQRDALPQSRRLATILQRKLNLIFGVGNQIAEAPLAILGPVKAPAVMIELGFITSSQDRARLQTPEFLRQVAAAIASGLEEFLE